VADRGDQTSHDAEAPCMVINVTFSYDMGA